MIPNPRDFATILGFYNFQKFLTLTFRGNLCLVLIII